MFSACRRMLWVYLGMQQRLDGRLWFEQTAHLQCLLWRIDKAVVKLPASLHLRMEMLACGSTVVWHRSADFQCIRAAQHRVTPLWHTKGIACRVMRCAARLQTDHHACRAPSCEQDLQNWRLSSTCHDWASGFCTWTSLLRLQADVAQSTVTLRLPVLITVASVRPVSSASVLSRLANRKLRVAIRHVEASDCK